MNTYVVKKQENKSQSVSNAFSQWQNNGESTFQFVDNRSEAIAQRKLQEMVNNSLQVKQLKAFQEMVQGKPRFLPQTIEELQKEQPTTEPQIAIQHKQKTAKSSLQTSQEQAIQRTAWEKTDKGWKRQAYQEGRFEKDTVSERTAPSEQIGQVGWIFSSNTNSFYKSYPEYNSAVRPYLLETLPSDEKQDATTIKARAEFNLKYQQQPPASAPSIETTVLEGEDRLLGKKDGKIEFEEDVTHNYLLWSVPKYTGAQLLQTTRFDPGTELQDVSGEAAAEAAVTRGEGFMMKQTQEHMEALTALRMIQSDEGLREEDVLAQYGRLPGDRAINLGLVDPLHNPRDPESQSAFTSILTLIEDYYNKKEAGARAETEARLAQTLMDKTNGSTPRLVLSMLKVHGTKQEFNRAFFNSKVADDLAQDVTGRNAPFGSRDEVDEVTRAVLKDRDDPNVHLIGGRQAIFETVWGPKSADVVKKAAGRMDSLRSHGFKYHWNPKTTVQAKYEFPEYLKLIQAQLGPSMPHQHPDVQEAYSWALTALHEIIAAINEIPQMTDTQNVTELPAARKEHLQRIEKNNGQLEKQMELIRRKFKPILK